MATKEMEIHSMFTFFIVLTAANTMLAADIQPGSRISASDPNSGWSSPKGTFTFTFISDPSGVTSASFAAIIFGNHPNIPIWIAGSTTTLNGGAVDSSATISLVSNGNLELRNGTSNSLIWQSSTIGRGVSSAVLDESGNLVLRNGSGSIIWSSFDNPTDTIVPGQNFSQDQILRNGIYSFKLMENGNLTLYWNNSILYYNYGLNSSSSLNLTSSTLTLLPTGILALTNPLISIPQNLAYSNDFAQEGNNTFRFVKLDNDGNLRIYSSIIGRGTSIEWSALKDQCLVYGYCGNLGICSYNETAPVCGCPSLNFEPIDPLNSRQGCRRKIDLQSCQSNPSSLVLDHTLLLTYPPELTSGAQVFFEGYQPCRTNCLLTTGCIGSTSLADGTRDCYHKISSFISGYQSPSLASTSFFKICGDQIPNPVPGSVDTGKRHWKLKAWIVVVVVLITLVIVFIFVGSLWFWCFRGSPNFGGLASQYSLLEYASGAPVQFTYKELQRATKGFNEKLGAGGFGAVYKGVLANKTVAAIKQLEGIEQGEKQFRMEVATITSTHHLNLVRLIGFCSEGRHRLLVYEFMRNGSLDSVIFSSDDDKPGKILPWDSRYKIAIGTARGISYLHEECRVCIVHCDIKPENILLDENYNAKVSDFGLAKLVNPKDQRYRTLTSVGGTRGYLPPEWLANLPITSKSDVYSYGMVLLEIIGGKRNFHVSEETNRNKFWIWAYHEYEKGNFEAIIDNKLSRNETDIEQVKRAIVVSFWCIQEQPSQRPVMSKVVQMLEGTANIDIPPAPKATSEVSIGGGSNISSVHSTIATSSSLLKPGIFSSKDPDTEMISAIVRVE